MDSGLAFNSALVSLNLVNLSIYFTKWRVVLHEKEIRIPELQSLQTNQARLPQYFSFNQLNIVSLADL
ncbi:MAG: hypothetical protein CM1200mP24_04130 [Gammaproteobacteria bacterium]|nr:MAG: hypothetical protein CM1200mP24_04130 [Gammaproteobacteria bacterium]